MSVNDCRINLKLLSKYNRNNGLKKSSVFWSLWGLFLLFVKGNIKQICTILHHTYKYDCLSGWTQLGVKQFSSSSGQEVMWIAICVEWVTIIFTSQCNWEFSPSGRCMTFPNKPDVMHGAHTNTHLFIIHHISLEEQDVNKWVKVMKRRESLNVGSVVNTTV